MQELVESPVKESVARLLFSGCGTLHSLAGDVRLSQSLCLDASLLFSDLGISDSIDAVVPSQRACVCGHTVGLRSW